jgi:hypothetical protein
MAHFLSTGGKKSEDHHALAHLQHLDIVIPPKKNDFSKMNRDRIFSTGGGTEEN